MKTKISIIIDFTCPRCKVQSSNSIKYGCKLSELICSCYFCHLKFRLKKRALEPLEKVTKEDQRAWRQTYKEKQDAFINGMDLNKKQASSKNSR